MQVPTLQSPMSRVFSTMLMSVKTAFFKMSTEPLDSLIECITQFEEFYDIIQEILEFNRHVNRHVQLNELQRLQG